MGEDITQDTSASPNPQRPSWHLMTTGMLEKALHHYLGEAEKFQRLKEEERSKDLVRQYAMDAMIIKEIWETLPRKSRRAINPNRFSKVYKKLINKKNEDSNQ